MRRLSRGWPDRSLADRVASHELAGDDELHHLRRDAVEIKDYGKFKTGDRLPREVLERPAGSRGDIESVATWDRGRWTLEIRRARDTGDREHDVLFTDPGRPYYFGISVHDNAGDEDHSHTGQTALKLLLK